LQAHFRYRGALRPKQPVCPEPMPLAASRLSGLPRTIAPMQPVISHGSKGRCEAKRRARLIKLLETLVRRIFVDTPLAAKILAVPASLLIDLIGRLGLISRSLSNFFHSAHWLH
jgi:hypothetical protein